MGQKKHSTSTTGVRYRVHDSRKHGVKFDRYFFIRYRLDGKLREEGLGWASEGWTERKAGTVLAELKANQTTGNGPHTLKEKREVKADAEKQKIIDGDRQKINNLTFSDVFRDYLIYSQANKRSAKSWKREEQLARLHIIPVVKNLPLSKIAPIHLERLKKDMTDGGSSARTIRYALAVVRQVFNFAIREGLFNGSNPASLGKVVRPQEDNKKTRFLTRDEVERLLKELAKRSTDLHDVAMLSVYTGMRFGEIANLKWIDVDLFQGSIMLRNTKSAKNRAAFMTDDIKSMLARRGPGEPEELVFPARGTKNVPRKNISRIYYDVVGALFNENVTDNKLKIDFHSLRHAFASWLVEDGTNIYLVKELLGHSDLKLTERYAHVGQSQLKQAVVRLQK